ncbi:hypothetical protein FNV43_RR00235 [Rhamnella rubrinervis]|uniref:Uncharacterized protein n=1 Tax=Rhamnella rubrinervis TaxID=2594499 RepID=A0A8K0MR00_9ROSA|nr:hypothetical protein FNV43_RR00235 [Rhamnella rubrinervis]
MAIPAESPSTIMPRFTSEVQVGTYIRKSSLIRVSVETLPRGRPLPSRGCTQTGGLSPTTFEWGQFGSCYPVNLTLDSESRYCQSSEMTITAVRKANYPSRLKAVRSPSGGDPKRRWTDLEDEQID